MASISRRDLCRYIAGFSVVPGFGLWSHAVPAPEPNADKTWNIVLHGLHLVQWKSPVNSTLMRIILPSVSCAGHRHQYRVGPYKPDNRGYTLNFPSTVEQSPNASTNMVLPAAKLSIRDENSGIEDCAQCWIDLPKPASIQPLRPRTVATCITISGALVTTKPVILPAVTLLTFNLGATPPSQIPFGDTNHMLDLSRNLIVRSEPRIKPTDNGAAAFLSLLECLGGISPAEFNVDGDCCPPEPKSELGVSVQEEKTLQEINGQDCVPGTKLKTHSPGKKPAKGPGRPTSQPGCEEAAGLQIRACMTVFAQ